MTRGPRSLLFLWPLLVHCGKDGPAAPGPGGDGAARPDGPRTTRDGGAGDAAVRRDGQPPLRDGSAKDAILATDARFMDGAAGAGGALVPVFVAQGYMGRTTISCDDGRTWIADRSDDAALRCFSGGIDCDHNGGRAMGVTIADGWIVATWGWGEGNSVRRSRDGRTFSRVLDGTVFAGIEASAGRLAAIAEMPRVSLDQGASWQTAPGPMGFSGNIRATGGGAGGPFVAAGGDTVGQVMVSDDGLAWRRPAELPAGCGGGVTPDGIAVVGGRIVITHDSGRVCLSTDGGNRFSTTVVDMRFSSSVLWTGSELLAWGRLADASPVLARSADGRAWTIAPVVATSESGADAAVPKIEAVARSASGTFVTVEGEWDQWYERQRFYRSTDGTTWRALPRSAFVGSHPIRFLSAGLVDRSACP